MNKKKADHRHALIPRIPSIFPRIPAAINYATTELASSYTTTTPKDVPRTLPNAFEANDPQYKMAERKANSCDMGHVRVTSIYRMNVGTLRVYHRLRRYIAPG